MERDDLSAMELEALQWLAARGGSVLITDIPDKTETDVLGSVSPGIRTYKKLEKKELVVITEEDPVPFPDMPDFTFTEMVELTDEGRRLAGVRTYGW